MPRNIVGEKLKERSNNKDTKKLLQALQIRMYRRGNDKGLRKDVKIRVFQLLGPMEAMSSLRKPYEVFTRLQSHSGRIVIDPSTTKATNYRSSDSLGDVEESGIYLVCFD